MLVATTSGGALPFLTPPQHTRRSGMQVVDEPYEPALNYFVVLPQHLSSMILHYRSGCKLLERILTSPNLIVPDRAVACPTAPITSNLELPMPCQTSPDLTKHRRTRSHPTKPCLANLTQSSADESLPYHAPRSRALPDLALPHRTVPNLMRDGRNDPTRPSGSCLTLAGLALPRRTPPYRA